MNKKYRLLSRVFAVFFLAISYGFSADSVVLYTSMKDTLADKLQDAFHEKYPGTELEYYSAGVGKLIEEIEAEREAGGIKADVIWTSEVPDFYRMRREGLLEVYRTTEVANIVNPFGKDYDGSFTAARLETIGIVYNTNLLKRKPVQWLDLMRGEFHDGFAIADPASSGTAFMSVILLSQQFGWGFFESLARNGASLEQGSGAVIDDTATEIFVACLGVDYVAFDKMRHNVPVKIAYPPEMLVLPSPVAIFKDSANKGAAKKFVDFLLSKEGQTIIAAEGTIPVRNDVEIPARFNLPSANIALQRAIPIDYNQLPVKSEVVSRLQSIMKPKELW